MPFDEIVPPVAGGRVFETSVRPGLADVAPSGRVRLDGLARLMQDVAYADIEDAGVADLSLWVVRRMRMRIQGFPRFAQDLRARTWCSALARLWAERRTTLEGDGALVEAAGLWVHLDPLTGRPVPFPEPLERMLAKSAAGRTVKARLRHPPPPADAERSDWRFRVTDLDMAAHVNNAAYWEPLEERLIAGPEPQSLDAEIEFREPAQAGDVAVLHGDGALWIAGADGVVHASILIG
ncbi:MAG: acyl-[acyl-carrier-protein] thioesterase [Thermoleophilaceae bacterium]